MSKIRMQVLLEPDIIVKVKKDAESTGDKVAYILRKIITAYYAKK
jgi:hypothetical protein